MRRPPAPHKVLWFAALCALTLALSACAKKPSPEYDEAANRFSTLYRQKWDDAYLDPAMAEIEAKLRSVPKDSLDAEAAETLLTRIREGRERVQAEVASREQAIVDAQKPLELPSSPSDRGSPAPPPPATAAAAEDAGPGRPPKGAIFQGMTLEEFRQDDCFREMDGLDVLGKGKMVTWKLRDLPSCRDKHPKLTASLFLFDQGKLYSVVDKGALDYRLPDGGKPSP